jgi:hypothetical protein
MDRHWPPFSPGPARFVVCVRYERGRPTNIVRVAHETYKALVEQSLQTLDKKIQSKGGYTTSIKSKNGHGKMAHPVVYAARSRGELGILVIQKLRYCLLQDLRLCDGGSIGEGSHLRSRQFLRAVANSRRQRAGSSRLEGRCRHEACNQRHGCEKQQGPRHFPAAQVSRAGLCLPCLKVRNVACLSLSWSARAFVPERCTNSP